MFILMLFQIMKQNIMFFDESRRNTESQLEDRTGEGRRLIVDSSRPFREWVIVHNAETK